MTCKTMAMDPDAPPRKAAPRDRFHQLGAVVAAEVKVEVEVDDDDDDDDDNCTVTELELPLERSLFDLLRLVSCGDDNLSVSFIDVSAIILSF